MEYIFGLFLVLIGIFTNREMSNPVRKTYYNFILLYVILLLGLRYEVGGDTIGYLSAYNRTPSFSELWKMDFTENRIEPGYLFVCAFCRLFTKDFWLAQIVMAAITNSCIFIFLYRYCKNPFVGIFFYFIFHCLYFTTEIMRESAAVGIFLLNYKNLERHKWARYYFVSLFSVLFQYSAIITWFFPLVKYIKFNYIYIAFFCGFLVITPLVEHLNEMLTISSITGRVDSYVAEAGRLNLNWRIAELIKSGFPPAAALLILKFFKIKSKFSPYALLQILFCAGAFAIPLIFSRFTNYTGLFVIAIIANVLSIGKIPMFLRTLFVCVLLSIQAYFYSMMAYRWIPYVSVFEPKNIIRENPNR